eukprot:5764406-Prymnesium_polylepis.1
MAFGSSLAGRKAEPGPTCYHTTRDPTSPPTRLGAKGPCRAKITRRMRVPWRGGRPSDSR